MNTIDPQSTGCLKLGLHTTVNNEWSDAPGYAYLEIGAEEARAILDLTGLTGVFREQAHRAGLICPLYAVSFGVGDKIPRFCLIEIPFEDTEPDSDRPVVRLPADFNGETAAGREHRVECHRIHVDTERVWFTALLRKGSDEFTTADLSADLLRAIAEGRDCGLPLAALTPDNSTNNLN